MSDVSSLIKLMMDITSKASRFLSRDYYELKSLQSSKKSTKPFVDKAILKINNFILSELQRVRPEFGVDSPDFKKDSIDENKATWLVNIMDGEENFSRAIPLFGIGIAIEELIYGNQEITYGLIAFPILDEVYFSERGKGSWYVGTTGKFTGTTRLRVSERKTDDSPLILDHTGSSSLKGSTKNFGSDLLACSCVASGRADIAMINSVSSQNAAGVILVKEAGGVVEQKGKFLMCSNGHSG